MSVVEGCPLSVPIRELGLNVSLLERCPHFRQASMESGPEDVSLLERCPRFRQASMELGREDVPLL